MTLVADFASCLGHFDEPIRVRRSLPTPLNYGRRMGRESCETLELRAVVQPMQTQHFQDDEGDRDEGRLTVWTKELLLTQKTAQGVEADIIEWGGFEWEVRVVRDWRSAGNYVYSEAVRRDP